VNSQQLAILVRAWANRLLREIGDLEEKLPETMERYDPQRLYVGPRNALGQPVSNQAADNPANWRVVLGDFVALDGLRVFLEELRQAERDLLSGKADE
jgi:hypothetical protein